MKKKGSPKLMFNLNDLELIINSDLKTNFNLETFEEILPLMKNKSLSRSHTLFQIWLGYQYFNSKNPKLVKKAMKLIESFVNEIKSDGVEIFRPCNNIEWFLIDFGVKLLKSGYVELSKSLYRLVLDLVKMDNNQEIIAITSQNLAIAYFTNGEKLKAAKLFEISSSLYEDLENKIRCLEFASILYYPTQIIHSIKLLKNAMNLLVNNEKYKQTSNNLEIQLNKLRRELILTFDELKHDIIFDTIKELTQSYHEQKDYFNLAASYYETAVILDKLGYDKVSYQYLSEAARISADNELWVIYSKATLQIVMKSIESSKFQDAEDILKDLDQIGHYLQDQTLLKQVETLFQALQKQKVRVKMPFAKSEINDEVIDISNKITDKNLISNNKIKGEPEVSEIKFPTSSQEQQVHKLNIQKRPNNHELKHIDQIKPQNQLEQQNQVNIEDNDSGNDYLQIRNQIGDYLKSHGYEIQYDETPFRETITIDIIASKGKVRKRKMFVMISNSLPEAAISANLLNGMTETGEKYVYFQSEDEILNVPSSPSVKIISQKEQIKL